MPVSCEYDVDKDMSRAALKYAGEARRQPKVQSLLRQIGSPNALAGFGDPIDVKLFRGITPVMRALVRAGAGLLCS